MLLTDLLTAINLTLHVELPIKVGVLMLKSDLIYSFVRFTKSAHLIIDSENVH